MALVVMTAFVRALGARHVGLIESMFYRNLIATPLILSYIAATRGFAAIKTDRLSGHITRSIVGVIGMACTFEAYRELHLADATTIGFTTPIFATILAALWLHEQVRWHRWAAVLVGFVGVLIVTQPGHSSVPTQGALIALASAFLIGVTSILLRQLGRTEAPSTTAFWFCGLSTLILAPAMPWCFHTHDMHVWMLVAGMGASGAITQVLLNASVRLAPVSTVINMDYSALIWSVSLGWLVFGELPAASTWMGVPLIVGSGLYIAWREHVRSRVSLAAPTPT